MNLSFTSPSSESNVSGFGGGGFLDRINTSITASISNFSSLTPGGSLSTTPGTNGATNPSSVKGMLDSTGEESSPAGARESVPVPPSPTSTYDEAMAGTGSLSMHRSNSSSNLFGAPSHSSSNSSMSSAEHDASSVTSSSPSRSISIKRGVISSSLSLSEATSPIFSAAGFSASAFSTTAHSTNSNIDISVLARSGVAGCDTDGKLPLAAHLASRSHVSGHLHKLGVNVRKWKRRFFVLQPTTMLYYYISSGDSQPAGVINMDTFTEIEEVDEKEFATSSSALDNDRYTERKIERNSDNDLEIDQEDKSENTDNLLLLPPPIANGSRAAPYRRRRRLQRHEQHSCYENKSSESRKIYALRLKRPDTQEEVILHAPSADDRSRWMESLSTLRFKTLQGTIDSLRVNIAEHEKRIKLLESDALLLNARHDEIWRAQKDEGKFRSDLAKRWDDLADDMEVSLGLRELLQGKHQADKRLKTITSNERIEAEERDNNADSEGNMWKRSSKPLFDEDNDEHSAENTAFKSRFNARKVSSLFTDDAENSINQSNEEQRNGSGIKANTNSPFIIKDSGSRAVTSGENECTVLDRARANEVNQMLPGDEFEARKLEQRRDMRVFERIMSISRTLDDTLINSKKDISLLRSKLGNLAKHVRGLERRESENAAKLTSALETISGLKQEKRILVKEIRRLREAAVVEAQERKLEQGRAEEAREAAMQISRDISMTALSGSPPNGAASEVATSAVVAAAASAASAALAKSTDGAEVFASSTEAHFKDPATDAGKSGMGEAEVNYDARLFRRELRVAIQEAIEIARPTRRSKIGMGASKQRHGHRDELMMHSWLLAPTDADSADEEFPVSGSQTIVSPTPILTSMSRASDSATTAGGTVTEPEGSAVMKKPTETGYFGSIGSTFAEALGLSSPEASKFAGRGLMASFGASNGEGYSGSRGIYGDPATNKQEAVHEIGHFEYKVVYQGGVGLRNKPDCMAPISKNSETEVPSVLPFQKCFVACERMFSPDDGITYLRLDSSHEINGGLIGWVFERTIAGKIILERGPIQRIDSSTRVGAEEQSIDHLPERSGASAPSDLYTTRDSDSKPQGYLRKLDGNTSSFGVVRETQVAGTLDTDKPVNGSQDAISTADMESPDSWEVVFHAKKIGIQFKQGKQGRIVVSKLSDLVLFGLQRMPRVGAVLVACNSQLLHGISWKQVAQNLKSTGRPLRLTFTEDNLGDDAAPPPSPRYLLPSAVQTGSEDPVLEKKL